jgi:hypothetical protein
MTDDKQLVTQTPTLATQEESIRLERNSRGFNWDIKILIREGDDKACIERINNIHNELKIKYGNKIR